MADDHPRPGDQTTADDTATVDSNATDPGHATDDGLTEEPAPSGVRSLATVYLKGLAMGSADTVPGVSGGTIALIVGIYERLIAALTAVDPGVLRLVPRLHRADGRRRFATRLREMDVPFLVALGLGMVTAVVLLSRVFEALLDAYVAETYAFFFGLILAGAVVLWDDVEIATAGQAAAAVAGFAVAFVVAGVSSGDLVPSTLPAIFLAGTVAVSATILPGISGAFILVLLGQYEYLTDVLTRFVDAVVALPSTGVSEALVDDGLVVVAFGLGALLGVFTLAYVIRWAFRRSRAATLVFLVSLMVGSLRRPLVEIQDGVGTWSATAAAGVVVAAVVGALAVFALDHFTDDLDYDGAI